MKNRRYGGSLMKAAALGFVLMLGALGTVSAQDVKPRVLVEAPGEEIEIKEGGPNFQVNILVENVENLAAFQFSLSYDPSILKYVEVKEGTFLGSGGREPKCLDPRVEPGDPEVLRFNCVTMGSPVSLGGPAGPSGSGVLATVTFSPVGGGTAALELLEGRLVAAEIDEEEMPVELETTIANATVEVIPLPTPTPAEGGSSGLGGISWFVLGPIIGIGVVLVAGAAAFTLARRREP
ncbi:MAG: cohesin domain-containing protein [Dehalococcoidia bacterium]|nr:cohesin domain-containing protein [Dehalococcoidia bacterium]